LYSENQNAPTATFQRESKIIKINNSQVGKAIATCAAAGVCGVLLWQTKGEHGIGWFIIALLIIW
jgi:hypothetical protein